MTALFAATAPFRTRSYGDFVIMVTRPSITRGEHTVLAKGNIRHEGVLCRVASHCLTSTALDAYDCDCVDQLRVAMERIHQAGRGLLIYMDQEGRGHGLATKVTAMNGKAVGLDTFRAVEELGLPPDIRDYNDAATILSNLRVPSVSLLTNNPGKVAALTSAGVVITDISSCAAIPPPPGAVRHLEAKRRRGFSL